METSLHFELKIQIPF